MSDYACTAWLSLVWSTLFCLLTYCTLPGQFRHLKKLIVSTGRSLHCKEILIYVFSEKKLRGLSPNFHTHVYVSNLFIPTIGPLYFPAAEQADRSCEYMYKSPTETWMQELGLQACSSFSGNLCFEFSVLCLCSVFTLTSGCTNLWLSVELLLLKINGTDVINLFHCWFGWFRTLRGYCVV